MSNIWNICGVALVFAFCAMIVRETNARAFPFVGIFGGVMLLLYALSRYAAPLSYIYTLAQSTGISEYISLVLKVLAIGYAVGISSDICRDMGEARVASGIEALGRAEILLLCLPVISEAVESAVGMLA